MTLWRYLLAGFLRSLVAVQAVIALLVLLAAGVENLRRFSDAPAAAVLQVTLLQAPEVLYQAFPLVLMLASLVHVPAARAHERACRDARGRGLGAAADRGAGLRRAGPGRAGGRCGQSRSSRRRSRAAPTMEDALQRARDQPAVGLGGRALAAPGRSGGPDGDPGGARQSRRHGPEPGPDAPLRRRGRALRADRGGIGAARDRGLAARRARPNGGAARTGGSTRRPRRSRCACPTGAHPRADPRQLLAARDAVVLGARALHRPDGGGGLLRAAGTGCSCRASSPSPRCSPRWC